MPENTIYVGRPSKWGNPFRIDEFSDAARCVETYREWLSGRRSAAVKPPPMDEIKDQLAGKNLACWCAPGAPCHADVLLEVANSP